MAIESGGKNEKIKMSKNHPTHRQTHDNLSYSREIHQVGLR